MVYAFPYSICYLKQKKKTLLDKQNHKLDILVGWVSKKCIISRKNNLAQLFKEKYWSYVMIPHRHRRLLLLTFLIRSISTKIINDLHGKLGILVNCQKGNSF